MDPEIQRKLVEAEERRIQRIHMSPPRFQPRQRSMSPPRFQPRQHSPDTRRVIEEKTFAIKNPVRPAAASPHPPLLKQLTKPPALADIMNKLLGIPGNRGFKWMNAWPDDITTEASESRVEAYLDRNGEISRLELIDLVQEPKSMILLQELNVNVLFLIQLSRVLFPHENSSVTYDELLHLLLACRGDTPATVSALAGGFTYVAKEFAVILQDIEKFKKDMDTRISKSEEYAITQGSK